jgi:hypothetical protein
MLNKKGPQISQRNAGLSRFNPKIGVSGRLFPLFKLSITPPEAFPYGGGAAGTAAPPP